MFKKTLLLFLFISTASINAQERIGIAFIPISYDENTISSGEAKLIQESVLNYFVSDKKFSVVDREKLEELEKEKKLQKTESFIDSKVNVTDGISKGASCLISTSILGLFHSEVKGGWESTLHLQIKVLDVSTGEILATENLNSTFINADELTLGSREAFANKKEIKEIESQELRLQTAQKNQTESFLKAIERLVGNVKRFSNTHFPLSVNILNWDEKKKDVFVLASGSKLGMYPGQLLDVMQITEVKRGEETVERSKKIAVACVVKVEDDNFSEAKIISTEKQYKKVRQEGSPIKIVTR